MADLLLRHGAIPSGLIKIGGLEAFTAACLRLDKEEVQATLRNHPEYLLSHVPIFAAARKNRVDVVEFLLDLGVSMEVEDETKQRPLHEAASHDSLEVAKLLVERGAEIEPVETTWNNTPLNHAMYGNITRMIDFLSGFTRNVYYLTWLGKTDRLREVLNEDPQLAKTSGENNTPLMWLPEDATQAKQIIELLVENGADPTVTNSDGLTAADLAERRGQYEAAELLKKV
jgi:ankyrin repeat protein